MVIETKITIEYYTDIPRFMQGVNGFFITEISQRSDLKTCLARTVNSSVLSLSDLE